jgi:hypothetical protein
MSAKDRSEGVHREGTPLEEPSFDELAKGRADGAMSRDRALKLVGVFLLGTGLTGLFPDLARAKRRHHRHRVAPPPICGPSGCSSSSGIVGQVTIGPLSPVERPGMVNYGPYQATISVLNQRGQTMTAFKSDVNGRFRVPLNPGMYTLHPESSGFYPHAMDQSVTVFEDQFTEVSITYDSGIR